MQIKLNILMIKTKIKIPLPRKEINKMTKMTNSLDSFHLKIKLFNIKITLAQFSKAEDTTRYLFIILVGSIIWQCWSLNDATISIVLIVHVNVTIEPKKKEWVKKFIFVIESLKFLFS